MVNIEWVIVDGKLHHVSEYAHLGFSKRPLVTCPECNEVLTLKLGNINRYHAAHRINSNCSLSKTESALHFNKKMQIWTELENAWPKEYQVNIPCKIGHCKRMITLFENWDHAEVEKAVQNTRPDIVLYKDGKPLAGIEVAFTHIVDNEKRGKLDQIEFPWIELDLTSNLLQWGNIPLINEIRLTSCKECVNKLEVRREKDKDHKFGDIPYLDVINASKQNENWQDKNQRWFIFSENIDKSNQ